MIRQKGTKIRVAVGKSSSMKIAIDTHKNVVTIEGSLEKQPASQPRREQSTKTAKKHAKKTVIDALKRLDSKILSILRRNSSKLSRKDFALIDHSKISEQLTEPPHHLQTRCSQAHRQDRPVLLHPARPQQSQACVQLEDSARLAVG